MFMLRHSCSERTEDTIYLSLYCHCSNAAALFRVSSVRLSCVKRQCERLRHGSCSDCLSELSDFRRTSSSMLYCSAVKDLSLDSECCVKILVSLQN